MQNRIHLQTRAYFDNNLGYYVDPLAPSQSYYENDYLALNPTLHEEDATDKFIAIRNVLSPNDIAAIFTVVDIGCGTGEVLVRLLDYLETQTGRLISGLGVDISGKILERGPRDVRLIRLRADCRNLPVDDRSISLALCMDIIEHLDDPFAALIELRRLSDLVIIKVPLERSLYTLLRGGKMRLEHLRSKFGHLHHYNTDTIASLLDQAGFCVMRQRFLPIPRRNRIMGLFQAGILMSDWLFPRIIGGFLVCLLRASPDSADRQQKRA